MIAAFDSFFEDFPIGILEGFAGAGDGVIGTQGVNGLPQRPTFPAKDDSGKFSRAFGIDPLSLLLETLKFCKLEMLILERSPENPLFCKNKPVRRVRFPTELGIFPVNLLEEMSRRVSRVNPVKLSGNPPEKRLF